MCGVLTAIGGLYDIFRYVHRDVKPDNILVDENGEGKLTDFGMCVKIEDACLPENIGDGTPEYSAPETSTRHGASLLSEIYAVGVIFVEGLMNNCPFGEKVRGGHVVLPVWLYTKCRPAVEAKEYWNTRAGVRSGRAALVKVHC